MLKLDNRRSNKIDSIFVIALFTVFAITAFLLILIGAKQYKHTANSMDANYESRTISSYLTEKIRQNDTADTISVCELKGTQAIALKTIENDATYVTYIYYYNEALREIMVNDTSVFSLEAGQEIIKTGGFYPEYEEEDLLKISITTTEGNSMQLYLILHSDIERSRHDAI